VAVCNSGHDTVLVAQTLGGLTELATITDRRVLIGTRLFAGFFRRECPVRPA
jgi:hypothetical protein